MVTVELYKPLGGWACLSLTDETGVDVDVSISYIDGDVVSYILKKCYRFLTFIEPYMMLEFDGEEIGNQLVILTDKKCFICENPYLLDKGKFFDIDANTFIKKIVDDIENNLTEWASFGIFVATDEEYYTELEKNKKKLKKLINKVRKELEHNKEICKNLNLF